MERLRVGVIGTGRIAEGSHLPCLSRFKDVELVLCDRDPDRLARISQQYQPTTTYTDHATMLAQAGLDAVFVLTPPALLFPVARDCLLAGVATLVEKPPGLTTAQTSELADLATAAGCPTMVGLNRRFQPLLNRAKAIVETEGPIATMIVEFYHLHMDILRSIGATEEGLAAVLTSGCIHSIDLMRYLGGEVTEVYAYVDRHADRHADCFTALVRFAGGATAFFHNHLLGAVRTERLTIHGRRASAILEGLAERCTVHSGEFSQSLSAVEHTDPSAPQWADRPRQAYLNGWWDQDRYFLDCVKERRVPGYPALSLPEAVKTMALIDWIGAQWRGPVPPLGSS